MDNHEHILIKEDLELEISIKRITVGYVEWYNKNIKGQGTYSKQIYK
jgi:hypothetical protein